MRPVQRNFFHLRDSLPSCILPSVQQNIVVPSHAVIVFSFKDILYGGHWCGCSSNSLVLQTSVILPIKFFVFFSAVPVVIGFLSRVIIRATGSNDLFFQLMTLYTAYTVSLSLHEFHFSACNLGCDLFANWKWMFLTFWRILFDKLDCWGFIFSTINYDSSLLSILWLPVLDCCCSLQRAQLLVSEIMRPTNWVSFSELVEIHLHQSSRESIKGQQISESGGSGN